MNATAPALSDLLELPLAAGRAAVLGPFFWRHRWHFRARPAPGERHVISVGFTSKAGCMIEADACRLTAALASMGLDADAPVLVAQWRAHAMRMVMKRSTIEPWQAFLGEVIRKRRAPSAEAIQRMVDAIAAESLASRPASTH